MEGQHLRAQAHRVAALAAEVRAAAARLAAAAICEVDWRGPAARAFGERVREESVRLRRVGATVDDAAAAVALQAQVVEAVERVIGP